ncbi:transporter substrate-binding protein [Stutzerimonas azotifigens]|uniref:Transporter substrate-binding protein n=1 Tax=Stutzerimonas azotifigens TaxID=291995 RepID=A0ABR5YX56_9GAMM|nr:transporter substrate-binding protein [Stutzerimonas azotifigens]MBA1272533.1 transporter substrate-binding protein [Stutzerimonas azotifigens]
MPRTFSIGLLLSTDGTYRRMGSHALAGARDALAEINEDARHGFQLHATHINPQGQLGRYGEGAAALMGAGIRHLFGTITSASRKEIIPDLEQRSGLLWYACPYEGFESSENVLYLGGCPNQTLIPLLRYALRTFGRRAQLIGSNYVWGWESNRIAREALLAADGEVLAEKYFHLGSTAFAESIKAMMADPPAFILNNLVGESSYAFLAQLDQACGLGGLSLPVLSCNLTEAELDELGTLDNLRLLSCGPFFEAVDPLFSQRQQQRHGLQRCSHYYTGAYTAVHLFARALQHTGDDRPEAITDYLHQAALPTALGALRISPHNNHTSLPSHIAELQNGRFCLLHSEAGVVAPDPYLTATDLNDLRPMRATTPFQLRIVK